MRSVFGRSGSGRRLRLAALSCALLLAAVPEARAQGLTPLGADSVEVLSVRFPGVESVPVDALERAIAVRATRCRSPLFFLACRVGLDAAFAHHFLTDTATVRADAERIAVVYEAYGYPRAEVTPSIERRGAGVRVSYAVSEGEPLLVDRIEVRGLETLEVPLPERLPLAAGEPYSLPALEETTDYLRAALMERGFPDPVIEVGGDVDPNALRATLVLDVRPGPRAVFGDVALEVESPLDEAVVRKPLAVQPGTPFRPSLLERTERELYRLPIVARAVARGGVARGDTVVAVQVVVETRPQRAFDVEGTVSSTDCLEAGVFGRDRYFLGGPRLLTVGVSFSNLLAEQAGGSFPCTGTGEGVYAEPGYAVDVELWQPWAWSARNSARLRAFVRRESSPDVYVQRGFGGEVAFARDLGRGFDAQLAWEPQRNELDAAAVYFCGAYGVCDAGGIAALSEPRWLAPVQFIGLWASRDADRPAAPPGTGEWTAAPPEPWRFRVRGAAESAAGATLSDYTFTKLLVEGSATRLLGDRIELAARTRLGTITGTAVLPPQIRLFSGGVETVRGAAQNLVGPKVLLAEQDPGGACAPDCDLGTLGPEDVTVRPTGGDRLAEANLEARYWLSSSLQVAAFVDFGRLSRTGGVGPAEGSLLSPGIGLRLVTDLGPIRLDLGYDPSPSARHAVYAQTAGGDVRLLGTALFDPYGFDGAGPLRRFMRRLQLHMAIGQAF